MDRLKSLYYLLALLAALTNTACSGERSFSSSGSIPIADPVAALATCLPQVQAQAASQTETQLQWYQDHASPKPSESKQTQLLTGTNGKSVVLVHGFNSSPESMNDIGSELNKSGFTVIIPLLTGFGSDAAAANSSTLEDWHASVEAAVATAQLCPGEVSMIGHSLGGALVADELINRHIAGIANAVLLAPAFRIRYAAMDVAISLLLKRTASIDPAGFKASTGIDPYTYLPFLKPAPGAPAPYIPLAAAESVVQFENAFSDTSAISAVPALTFVSQSDFVTDGAFAETYARAHFSTVKTTNYPSAEGIGHFLESRADNPHFDELMSSVLRLLSGN